MKPVQEEEIREALIKARKNMEHKLRLKNDAVDESTLKQYQGVMKSVFLTELLRGKFGADREKIRENFAAHGVELKDGERVLLLSVSVARIGTAMDGWKRIFMTSPCVMS